MKDNYAWADFWTHALGKLGYEVWEPVGNAELMQKKWAIENGVSFRKKLWETDIITAQAISFKPEVLFVNGYGTNSEFINNLRQRCSSIKLVLCWCSILSDDASAFKMCDVILSNVPESVKYFRSHNYQSEYFRHAFEPRILNKIDSSSPKQIDFSFIGSIVKAHLYHNQREFIIKELLQKTSLKIWLDVHPKITWDARWIKLRQMVYYIVKALKKVSLLKPIIYAIPKVRGYASLKDHPKLSDYVDFTITKKAHPPLFGSQMYQCLYNSKVVLNNHDDGSPKSASNMRLFEVTGVGSCLLTDWKENLHELFELDKEVVTYRSLDECLEKEKWLLDHPQEREAIAKAGQARTLNEHTFDKRAIELDKIIKKYI